MTLRPSKRKARDAVRSMKDGPVKRKSISEKAERMERLEKPLALPRGIEPLFSP